MGRARAFFTLLLSLSLLIAGFSAAAVAVIRPRAQQQGRVDLERRSLVLPSDATFFPGDDGAPGRPPAMAAITSLTIVPQNPEIDIAITNGQIVSITVAGDGGTASPLAFTALGNGGASLAAAWMFDRGELGMMTAAGVFTPGTTYAGQGTVTAAYGRLVATTKVTVKIASTQNGAASTGPSDAGTDAEADAAHRRASAATTAWAATCSAARRCPHARATARAGHGPDVGAATWLAVSVRQDGLAARHPRAPAAVADDARTSRR